LDSSNVVKALVGVPKTKELARKALKRMTEAAGELKKKTDEHLRDRVKV